MKYPIGLTKKIFTWQFCEFQLSENIRGIKSTFENGRSHVTSLELTNLSVLSDPSSDWKFKTSRGRGQREDPTTNTTSL